MRENENHHPAPQPSNNISHGLHASEYYFELLESIREPFYGLDSDWRFIYLNRKAEEALGRKRETLLGKRLWEEFPDAVGSHSSRQLEWVMQERQSTRYETLSVVLHYWIEVEISPTSAGVSVHFRNIHERKQAQLDLENKQQQLRLISDALPGLISYIDPQLRYQFVNKGYASLFEVDREAIIGQPFIDGIGPAAFATGKQDLEEALSGKTVRYEQEIPTPTGSQFTRTQLLPHMAADGTVLGAVSIVEDITEAKRAEAQIRELNEGLERLVEVRTAQLQSVNRELDSFAYVVSHDLKAPLRGVSQLATWLADDYAQSLDAEGRNMLNLMIGRSKRMHQMIEGILQYSRIGRVRENPIRIHLNVLVAEIVDLLAPSDRFEITVAPNLPIIYGDEMRIRQVFQNLIENAIKYMDKPIGKISVTSEDHDTHWQFAIADNGPGIASQYYDKIFQIFQTLTARDTVESTGIGLSLVKKIIELMDGRIWLESVEGQGTTFYFTLPKLMRETIHEE